MNAYLTGCDGKTWALPQLLSWDICHGLGEPCDFFEVGFMYDETMLKMLSSAVRFKAEHAGKTVFSGVVDEYRITADDSGCTAVVSGRSLAALLLDNEAETADYYNLSLDTLIKQHVEPYGIKKVEKCKMAPLKNFGISSGESEWSVLRRFCRYSGGVWPRFLRDGTLSIGAAEGSAVSIANTAVSQSFTDIRYGIISEVLVKNRVTGRRYTVKNEDYVNRGGSSRRVITVPKYTSADTVRHTAQYQIAESDRSKRYAQIVVPELFAAFAGDTVKLGKTNIGVAGQFKVCRSRCRCDGDGAQTALTLEEL